MDVPITPETVEQSVMLALGDMPREVATSATALGALELAKSIDQGPQTYRFQAGLVKELRACMAELVEQAELRGERGDDVDDLAARRAVRRAAAGPSEPATSG